MTPCKFPQSHSRNAAFSLVELTIALGVMGFCLLAIFGLLPVGINSNRNAVATTEAVGVATNILAEARAAAAIPSTESFTSRIGLPWPIAAGETTLYFTESGEKKASGTDAKYRAVVTVSPDKDVTTLFWVRTVISWPAPADPKNAAGSFSALTSVVIAG